MRTDLARALRLASPAEGICSATRLTLAVVDATTGATSLINIGWDPARAVVWRNASGSYLTEHAISFAVRYLDARGEEMPLASGGVVDAASREAVRAVRVEMTLRDGTQERKVVLTETIGGGVP